MLMPKRVKWRKQMRGRLKGKALRGAEVSFGEWGLQALEPGWITARQIEAARRAIVREMKRRGKVWIRIFPAKPYTRRAAETRMGNGKGSVEYYVAVVKPGRVMIEIGGLGQEEALRALKLAQYKFSIKTKIVTRHAAGAGE
ncbi:MAG: 50S ribosomal protein L16 [Anaerolineales bacterium]|nr:50S ribosomal protein L16 [Anaerolineales bacterium]MCX7755578.1 50S ribosomal protein L16 [Anaerolineales bacterium]MDW8278383.1 50S ribosomal protein L16 [Anaerolineales bacterium]